MFERYQSTDRIQNIVARSLSEHFPFVGSSADWVNRAWEIYSMINREEYRQIVIFENDDSLEYSIYSHYCDDPENDDKYTELETVRFGEECESQEIVSELIKISMKYWVKTEFQNVGIGDSFCYGGTNWEKSSTRTARIADSSRRVFYFSKTERVSIDHEIKGDK